MAKKETVTFLQGKLPAVEWNGETETALFSFERRLLTTSDSDLIKLLDLRGYERYDYEVQEKEPYTQRGNVKGASTSAKPAGPKVTGKVAAKPDLNSRFVSNEGA